MSDFIPDTMASRIAKRRNERALERQAVKNSHWEVEALSEMTKHSPGSPGAASAWKMAEIDNVEKRLQKAKTEREFQERQAGFRAKQEAEKKLQKEMRQQVLERRRQELDSWGMGPDRWLWPKARDEPRGWAGSGANYGGGDIGLLPGTQSPTPHGPGSILALPVKTSPGHSSKGSPQELLE